MSSPSTAPREVLVVDDSETVRRELSRALATAGFTAVEAADGMAGLKLAQERRFVMIILDVNMPRMNGLEMLEQLRLGWATLKVPVVILTTEADQLMIERARKAGAKGWLIKPVTPAHVISTVQSLTQSGATG